jgi:hypothetical protein
VTASPSGTLEHRGVQPMNETSQPQQENDRPAQAIARVRRPEERLRLRVAPAGAPAPPATRSVRVDRDDRLVSRRVSPPPGARGWRGDFDKQLVNLTEEYGPRTQTQRNAVACLAGEWVQKAQYAQQIQALLDTGVDTGAEQGFVVQGYVVRARQFLANAEAAAASFASGLGFDTASGGLALIANYVRHTAAELKEAAHRFRAAAHPDLDPGDREAAVYDSVKPEGLEVFDPGVVERVLADGRPESPAERRRWNLLMAEVVGRCVKMVTTAELEEARVEQSCRQGQGSLAEKFDELDRLTQLEGRCVRNIARWTVSLRGQ